MKMLTSDQLAVIEKLVKEFQPSKAP